MVKEIIKGGKMNEKVIILSDRLSQINDKGLEMVIRKSMFQDVDFEKNGQQSKN